MFFDRIFGRKQPSNPADTEELFRAMGLLEPHERERFLGSANPLEVNFDSPGLNVRLSDNSGPMNLEGLKGA